MGSEALDSTGLENFGVAGPGRWITVYANSAHAWIVVAGIALDTADYGGAPLPAGSGPRRRSEPLANLGDGSSYVARHPAGCEDGGAGMRRAGRRAGARRAATHETPGQRASTRRALAWGAAALVIAAACGVGWGGIAGCGEGGGGGGGAHGGGGAGARESRQGARASSQGTPLGRAIAAQPAPVRAAPAPVGDPPSERGGTLPAGEANAEDAPARGVGAASPQAALRRYALLYSNWSAAGLAGRERLLAALGIGPARLEAEQTGASGSAIAALVAAHVRNSGVVVAIARGEGAARGWWVVVTRERTSGDGVYAGLPPGLHVTEARVVRDGRGWVVWGWRAEG